MDEYRELDAITDETASKYGMSSRKALYALIEKGVIPHVKIRRRVYLRPSAMAKYLDRQTVEPTEAPDPNGPRKGRG